MFKTFYGLAFKHYFINSETLELYRNKYISNIVYGWFLIVSVDGGATWEEVKHVSSGILEIRYKNYLIGLISDVEESKEIKQGAYTTPPKLNLQCPTNPNIHYKFIPKITFKPYYKFNIYHKIQHFIILF